MATITDSPTRSRSRRQEPASFDLETVDCRLCGGTSFDTVLATRDPLKCTRDEFRVVQCRNCELVQTNPRPTAETIGVFYPQDYCCHDLSSAWDNRRRARWRRVAERAVLRRDYNYPPQPVEWWSVALATLGRAWMRTPIRRSMWIPFPARRGRLLDFGCGAGAFLRRMRDLGWRVEGLDVSRDLAAAVSDQLGITVHVGSLPHASLEPQSYDLLTMWQALEHVHDPRAVVRAAANLLRPGGLFYATVPNFESWGRVRFGHSWYGLDVPRHLTHFAPQTLARLVEAEGFRVQRIEQVGMDGWIRHSARRARAFEMGSWRLQACRFKPLAKRLARRSERANRADNLLVAAEKI